MKDNVIELFNKNLRKEFGEEIKEIILYGSRARGDNKEDSDYDFIVLCKSKTKEIKEYARKVRNELLINNFAVASVVVLTAGEYEKRKYEPYLMNIKREGMLV